MAEMSPSRDVVLLVRTRWRLDWRRAHRAWAGSVARIRLTCCPCSSCWWLQQRRSTPLRAVLCDAAIHDHPLDSRLPQISVHWAPRLPFWTRPGSFVVSWMLADDSQHGSLPIGWWWGVRPAQQCDASRFRCCLPHSWVVLLHVVCLRLMRAAQMPCCATRRKTAVCRRAMAMGWRCLLPAAAARFRAPGGRRWWTKQMEWGHCDAQRPRCWRSRLYLHHCHPRYGCRCRWRWRWPQRASQMALRPWPRAPLWGAQHGSR